MVDMMRCALVLILSSMVKIVPKFGGLFLFLSYQRGWKND